MRAGTYLREQLPGSGWRLLTSRTDLAIVALREPLVERAIASSASARGYYWWMPPSAARETTLFGRAWLELPDAPETRAS